MWEFWRWAIESWFSFLVLCLSWWCSHCEQATLAAGVRVIMSRRRGGKEDERDESFQSEWAPPKHSFHQPRTVMPLNISLEWKNGFWGRQLTYSLPQLAYLNISILCSFIWLVIFLASSSMYNLEYLLKHKSLLNSQHGQTVFSGW